MEGVAFALFDAYDVLRQLGATPKQAVIAGGGARSVLWRQIIADVFDLPIVPLQTEDQSTLGAALLAAAGNGAIDLVSAVRSWSGYGPPVEPRPELHARYKELLAIYRDAYVKHRDDFARLAALA
jgi:xylulokinase